MNHKNERILKLWNKGIKDPVQLARKTDLPIERIKEGLKSLELE
jgi:hypothetical protein